MDRHEEFMSLFLRHQRDLLAFLGSIVRDPHLRDDLLQEVALTLWRKYDEYDPTRPFGAWARGIAANKLLQQHGRDARKPLPFSPESIQAIVDAYERESPVTSHHEEALQQCMEQLPEKSKQLLKMRYEQSLPFEKIAERVRSTSHAVHMAISRLRVRLGECIQSRLRAMGEI